VALWVAGGARNIELGDVVSGDGEMGFKVAERAVNTAWNDHPSPVRRRDELASTMPSEQGLRAPNSLPEGNEVTRAESVAVGDLATIVVDVTAALIPVLLNRQAGRHHQTETDPNGADPSPFRYLVAEQSEIPEPYEIDGVRPTDTEGAG
jgi:hypothetical protein